MSQSFKHCLTWFQGPSALNGSTDGVCSTRDVFQGKLDSFFKHICSLYTSVDETSLLTAILGEIGNNCFDHNLAQWKDVPGSWFHYEHKKATVTALIVDRGQGVLSSLKKVKPQLKTDEEAIKVAFYERLSGRSPEKRGNGLKFVRNIIESRKNVGLFFTSGQSALLIGSLSSRIPEAVQQTRGHGTLCFLLWEMPT